MVKKVKRFANCLPERSSGKVCEAKQKTDHKSTTWKAVRTVEYGRAPVNYSRSRVRKRERGKGKRNFEAHKSKKIGRAHV